MYFPVLSVYCYNGPIRLCNIRNVGWLDKRFPFEQGETSDEFHQALFDLCKKPIYRTRGYHFCPYCPRPENWEDNGIVERNGESVGGGTAEIWVRGKGIVIYAAPNLILHYLIAHRYLPPAAFIEAVLQHDFKKKTECSGGAN